MKNFLFALGFFCLSTVALAEDLAPPTVEGGQPVVSIQSASTPVVSARPAGEMGTTNEALNSMASGLLLSKLNILQQQMQSLNGKIEVLEHDVKMLNQQQQAFYQDIDTRLNQSNGKAKTVNSVKPDTSGMVLPIINKPSASKPTAKQTVNGDGRAKADYTKAYNLIKQKQYAKATKLMTRFLQQYPNSSYIPNATYWLGELYMSQGDIDQAIQQFSTVVQRYPVSTKAPGAQLKLGFAYYDKGQWAKARQTLKIVKKNYPGTSVARLATARLNDMIQQGL